MAFSLAKLTLCNLIGGGAALLFLLFLVQESFGLECIQCVAQNGDHRLSQCIKAKPFARIDPSTVFKWDACAKLTLNATTVDGEQVSFVWRVGQDYGILRTAGVFIDGQPCGRFPANKPGFRQKNFVMWRRYVPELANLSCLHYVDMCTCKQSDNCNDMENLDVTTRPEFNLDDVEETTYEGDACGGNTEETTTTKKVTTSQRPTTPTPAPEPNTTKIRVKEVETTHTTHPSTGSLATNLSISFGYFFYAFFSIFVITQVLVGLSTTMFPPTL